MSANSIAKATYTSPPLLVRIAKKLGYHGWNDFKDAFINELEYLFKEQNIDASIPFVVSDDIMTIAHNIGQLQIETIQDTMSLINHDDLQQALRYLRDCKELDIYGVSNNLLLAEEFKAKLFYLHKNVNICHLPGNAKVQAAMSTKEHCAILISYSGETNYIIDVAEILKNMQTPIIAITSIADNNLSKLADVTLRISSREMLLTKIGDFATTASIKYILDTLYAGIFSFDYQKNLDYKIQIAKLVDDRHSGYEFIDEDE
ncbi:MurR/RpiR family transcriptional regulator [Coprobacillaceae bacterium CR2/5/TPMF4]|nr:MurR/RpiR family transcriptional regulator [Coprobacillaceae bacterium CR2/5/TPMF4]